MRKARTGQSRAMAGSAYSRGSACKFTTWSLKGVVGILGTYPSRGLRTSWELPGPNPRHESSTENACRSPTLLTMANAMARSWSQSWSGLIWSSPSGVTVTADAICPRSLWKCFSGTALLLCKDSRQFSIDWACSNERRAVRLTEFNSMPRKEILCTGENFLFSQLTWSPNMLRWQSTVTALETGPVWASRRGRWERECLLPLMEQGLPPPP